MSKIGALMTDEERRDDDERNDDTPINATLEVHDKCTRMTLVPKDEDSLARSTTCVASRRAVADRRRIIPTRTETDRLTTFLADLRSSVSTERSALEDPIEIRNVPVSVRNDANDLHVSIDPYQMILKHFQIVETSSSTVINDTTLMNFFKSFLNTYGCNVTKGSLKDTVRMRGRLKTDYPHIYDKDRNIVYHVLFVPR